MKYFKKHWISILFTACSITVMVFIWLFSAQNGEESTETSDGVTQIISQVIVEDFDLLSEEEQQEQISLIAPYVRKFAHFSIYASLGFFVLLAVRSFFEELSRKAPKFSYLAVGVFCFLYAMTDELHQRFVADRSGNFVDICIDFSGAVLGIIIACLIVFIFVRIREHYQKNKKLPKV